MSDVVVRTGTEHDARAIAELQIQTMRAAFNTIVPEDVLASWDVDEFTRWRRERTPQLRADGGETFVAEQNETVVGFASVGRARDADIDGGELYALYAHPDVWGSGVGRKLLDAVHGVLEGFPTKALWVFESNARARRFYEQAGWKPDGARKTNGQFGNAVEVRYRR